MKIIDTTTAIIRSKLHRPAVVENHVHRKHLLNRLNERLQRPLTLVSAPAGYGKTMLVCCWLEAISCPSAWVSLDTDDNDLRLFLSYFLSAVRSMFPNACTQTRSMAKEVTLPPLPELAGNLINELDRIERPFILVLDDFHLTNDKNVLELLTQLLRHPPKFMHLVLIGRRDPSLPISTFRARKTLTEIRTQDLRFNTMETVAFLTQELGTEIDLDTAVALEEKTEGWVTGLRLAALSMRHRGTLDPRLLEAQVNAQYVMEYLFNEVFSSQPPEIKQYLLGTAILNRFCGSLCEAVCIPVDESSMCTFGGWNFIDWLKKENMFVIPLDAESRWFRFHHLFKKLLCNQVERRLSREEISSIHARASAWFAENGMIEEALKHALDGGNIEGAAQLTARHGFGLLDREQWPRLKRWLKMLPTEIVERHPDLLALMAWLHMIYARYTDLFFCLDKAEALSSTHTIVKPIQGHLDALRGFQLYLAISGNRALTRARRASETIPRNHRFARIFSSILRALVHQMLGDRAHALSTIEKAMRDPDLSGGTTQGFFQTTPCLIYWIDADLANLLQTARQSLNLEEDSRKFQAMVHGRYFMGIAHYHRNELDAAKKNLVEVVRNPYSQHALNYAHSAFALALIYQARGREGEANQVAEAVVSYALDANNPGLLQVARAFKAELALRQGCLSEASLWVGNYQPLPFLPTYRFYMPQLTAVKVLQAQDTSDHRGQAADLLNQLHDFLVSIHNIRFQIDVLALKALFFDSQGDEPSALKALTESLKLAEPGGFIRPFVDLGLPMAILLKKQVQQNIAVGYIGRILGAFKADGRHPNLGKPDQLGTGQGPLINHPLIDPLTNREIEILECLAQRLSNKEIAVKLFIAPTTVKKHLNNLYGKLTVSNRRQAVEKAENIGILSPR